MENTEKSLKDAKLISDNEVPREKIMEEEHPRTRNYRIFTEDEMLLFRGRNVPDWSDKMKEESNLLYRLKYSEGKITPVFIEGVLECLEASEDFQVTSFGHSKFILFVAGNQPSTTKDIDQATYDWVNDQRKKTLKRLRMNFIIADSGDYSYFTSKSGDQWVLSEEQRNTLSHVTLKPDLCLWLRTWVEWKPKRIRKL